jgi:dienelactone hydrolase
MRTTLSSLMIAAVLAGSAAAQPASGPYAVAVEIDPDLPGHTVYRPADLSAVKDKLPVIAYGNGGCANVGTSAEVFLTEVASHGYVIAAPGPIVHAAPGSPPPAGPRVQSKPGQMMDTLAWAAAENAKAGGAYAGRLDLSKLAVMGGSCGGLEAIAAAKEPRVKTALVLNSGVIRGAIRNADGSTRAPSGQIPATEADLPQIRVPIVYLVGGPSDRAYPGAEADFAQINQVPVFNANLDVGHSGTWREPRGGEMGRAALAWLNWKLKGDSKAANFFEGPDCGLCKDPRWTVKKKGMK